MINKAKKEGKIFINPVPTAQSVNGFWKILWQYMTSKEERVPRIQVGPFPADASLYANAFPEGLRITWMGHSSMLIEIDGKRFLTDPVWGPRASFSSFMGPKRFFPYPLHPQNWPKLDAIIISHDHYDHLDYPTMKLLVDSEVPFITSLGVGDILEKWGIGKNRITELDWGGKVELAADFTITAAPARHFSGRGLTNRNQTLWSSFVIKGPRHNIFYGADSGWFPGFKDIGDTYGPFDLTMLEIGAYGEGWPDIHMGPDHATNAHIALKGKVMMPIHWGTFNLALHAWREPVERVLQLAKDKQISLFLPVPGQATLLNADHVSGWWEK